MASVFKRTWRTKDGKEHFSWGVSYKDQHGEWRQKTNFKLRRDAEEWMKKTLGEVEDGVHVRLHRKGITFDEAAQIWLDRLETEFEKPTADSRRWRYNRHIRQPLEQIRLSELNSIVLSAVHKKVATEVSRSYGTIIYGDIIQIVRLAKKRKLCNQGIVDLVDSCKPAAIQTRKKLVGLDIPRKEEVQLLLTAEQSGWLHDLMTVMAFTAMRPGEAQGLHWEDVDFERRQITVHTNLRHDGTFHQTKTKAGDRIIPMTQRVYETLRRRAFSPELSPRQRYLTEGQRLIEARAATKHGEWGAILKQHAERLKVSERTVYEFYKAACEAQATASNVVTLKPPAKLTGPVFRPDSDLEDGVHMKFYGSNKPLTYGMYSHTRADHAFANLQRKLGIFTTDPSRTLFDHSGNSGRAVRLEYNAKMRKIIGQIQASGITSVKAIARELTKRRIPHFTGATEWRDSAVYYVLHRDPAKIVKYKLHALRHFGASLFIEQGMDPKRLQVLMGHANIDVTFDTYGHLFPSTEDLQAKMAKAEASVFSPKAG